MRHQFSTGSPVLRFLWVGLLASACIDSGAKGASGDPEGSGGQGAEGGATADAGPSGTPNGGAGGGGESTTPDEKPPVGGSPADAGRPTADGGMLAPESGCDRLCDRVDACLPAVCPVLMAPPSQLGLCDFCAALTPEDVAKLVVSECPQIVETVFASSPEVAEICRENTPRPPDERCQAACEHMEACGLTPSGPGVPPDCGGLCAGLPPQALDCLAQNAECDALGRCLGPNGPGPGPGDPESQCGNVCRRTAGCLQMTCAVGTLPPEYTESCMAACLAEPLDPDELRAFSQSTCADIVAEVRAREPEIDARCDATPEQACTTLCRDRLLPCNLVGDQATCERTCADFALANLRCIQNAPECAVVAGCFGDDAALDRCERFCDRVEGCLLEACPPRVIPPDLGENCTAGCLPMAPDEMEVQQTEAATCADVRRFVYRNNRELAPICEAGRDFRPTADECAAFCDNGLEACLGIGGRPFCLAGCASLTRDQYACALEAHGDCGAIDTCLAGM